MCASRASRREEPCRGAAVISLALPACARASRMEARLGARPRVGRAPRAQLPRTLRACARAGGAASAPQDLHPDGCPWRGHLVPAADRVARPRAPGASRATFPFLAIASFSSPTRRELSSPRSSSSRSRFSSPTCRSTRRARTSSTSIPRRSTRPNDLRITKVPTALLVRDGEPSRADLERELCLRLQRGCGVRGWGRDDLGTGARGRGARARRALMSTTRTGYSPDAAGESLATGYFVCLSSSSRSRSSAESIIAARSRISARASDGFARTR